MRETEAEAVAFIVGQAVGLEMGTASSDYIQMYAGNAALLAESLEVIQRTSAVILAAITGEQPTTRCAGGREPWRRWRNEDHSSHPRAGRRLPARRSISRSRTRPTWRLSSKPRRNRGPLGLPAISVAHYGEQNGDLMRDPEMCFELSNPPALGCDSRHRTTFATTTWAWSSIPATATTKNYVFYPDLLHQHEQFARMWDRNLRAQGFVEAFERSR